MSDSPIHILRIHPPEAIHRQVGDSAPEAAGQRLARVGDRMVFNRERDEVSSAARTRERDPAQGEVIALRATAGEKDLLGFRAQNIRDGRSRRLHRG